jgi:outer membrane lipoprotein-sorting protein
VSVRVCPWLRLALALLLASVEIASAAETPPSARAILESVREAQTAQQQTVIGRLRTGGKSIPFRLIADRGTLRWEFTEPKQTIQLRLLESDSRLEEIAEGSTKRVTAARFDDKVRGSDITYEDLAMKFLYWPKAKIDGEQTMILRKCWIIRVEPPAKNDSQYSRAMLWIDKETGALMQAEAFGHDGRIARRFKVISPQKIDGVWLLKQMRIEGMEATRTGPADRAPTYLEVDGVEK